jgi:hypothetical protein
MKLASGRLDHGLAIGRSLKGSCRKGSKNHVHCEIADTIHWALTRQQATLLSRLQLPAGNRVTAVPVNKKTSAA